MSINKHDTVWTAEALELLETLAGLEENLTYREIAERMTARLGARFTKNSCIGRGRRMGLPPRSPREYCEPSPTLQPETSQAFVPIEPIEARIKRNGRDITMLQLRQGLCHWPSDGDRPPYTYCGRRTQLGNSFCADHSRVAYNAPKRTSA
jgi:GcrA cell cycle regulator